MLSPEKMYTFLFSFIALTLIVVYGSLFVTLASPETKEIPEKCTSGCPLRRRDNLFIKNVVECLYTEGRLSESRRYMGDFIKVCELEIDSGTYRLSSHQTLMY
jgi:hypothetical protein